MNILICNERLTARFGVDRLMFIVARGLADAGHNVLLLALRGDQAAAATIDTTMHIIEAPGMDLISAENYVSAWLATEWDTLFDGSSPDLVLIGGWPFFTTAKLATTHAVPSVLIDAGAVPHDGFDMVILPTQRELRRLRAQNMPGFTAILPISHFICTSQTIPDRGHQGNVTAVLLGADHLEKPIFAAAPSVGSEKKLLAECRKSIKAGFHLIFGLGRYETQGYKNSPALLTILGRLMEAGHKVKLILLASSGEIEGPDHILSNVVPVGHVSDGCMVQLMKLSTLSISPSLWEGFNLPLAESQWFSVPALAFACGAHAEVAAHPWLLCNTLSEMFHKAASILKGEAPKEATAKRAFDRFRADFQWSEVLADYVRLIEAIGTQPLEPHHHIDERRPLLLVDCTNSAVDPANPGVIRVARRLTYWLQRSDQFTVVFMRWDTTRRHYITLYNEQVLNLSRYDGPQDHLIERIGEARNVDEILKILPAHTQRICLFPEVVLDGNFPERILWCRVRGLQMAAILYDLIPISHAPLCSREVAAGFPEYLQSIASLDLVCSISGETLREFERYCARRGMSQPKVCDVVWLPSQFANLKRCTAQSPEPDDMVLVVCIASIDPRKNHRTLIEAYRLIRERAPASRLRLTLVGNRFDSADLLADWVRQQTRQLEGLTWTGLVSDQTIEILMDRAAFTIYPSIVEGFGLPIVESLWMGRPCLCHDQGVMSELAAPGGCMTVDMGNVDALADALLMMENNLPLRQTLCDQITARPLSDWRAYSAAITELLLGLKAGSHNRDNLGANALGRAEATALEQLFTPEGAQAAVIDSSFHEELDVFVTQVESQFC